MVAVVIAAHTLAMFFVGVVSGALLCAAMFVVGIILGALLCAAINLFCF